MDIPAFQSLDLTRQSWIKGFLQNRWWQVSLRALALAGFILAILTGLFGSQVGSRNFAIIFVWIGWWTALKLFFMPLGGRSWCSICPIPMPGEWLQQGWVVVPGKRGWGYNLKWPKALRNNWLQTAGFALIGIFSALTLTTPVITAWIFLGLIVAATLTAIFFERRVFCRHLCPIGAFIGCYAPLAPLELRPVDTGVCAKHVEKNCYTGCSQGAGCPWMNFPGALRDNTNCGLCMECLRTCSQDNISIRLRSPMSELDQPGRFRIDEAIFSLFLLGSVIFYSALFQGSWGGLKMAAISIGQPDWWIFVASFLFFTLAAIPGILAAAILVSQRLAPQPGTVRKLFNNASRALLPLGFSAWIAFTLSFALGKLAYLWPVLSDPFGWGWNLFGSAHLPWRPYLVEFTPILIAVVLAAGFLWSCRQVILWAKSSLLRAVPVLAFSLLVNLMMLYLLVG